MRLARAIAASSVLAWSIGLGVVGPAGCIIIGDDGSDEGPAAMDDGGTAATMEEEACLDPPHCDPLAPDCADAQICAPDGTHFSCVSVPPDTMLAGPSEPCSPGGLGCDEGLVCAAILVTGCDGPGCCVALCDVEQPQCTGADECTPYFTDSLCYPDVGVCIAP